MGADKDIIKEVKRRLVRLKADRSTWDAHWKELRDHVLPWAGFFTDDGDRPNDGSKRADPIETAGREALQTMVSGMQSGLTPRSVRWFALDIRDAELRRQDGVARWLDDTAQLIHDILSRSNFYHCAWELYESLGLCGTACLYMENDFDNVVRFKFVPVGEFYLSANWQGKPDTVLRLFSVPARQLVEEFGEEACTEQTRQLARDQPDTYVRVVHAVMPRKGGKKDAVRAKEFPFASYYFEEGAPENGGLLRESGYRVFPYVTPRWQVHDPDIYGHSPAMDALADIKQAREMLIDTMNMVNNITHPPLQAPASMDQSGIQIDPGTVNYVENMRDGKIEPVLTTEYDINRVQTVIQWVESKIQQAFHYDVFKMFTPETPVMTATQVMEMRQEKLSMLGPVLERMQTEIFAPLIDRIFDRCAEAGILPPLPEVLARNEGADIDVLYVSPLSMAQSYSRITSMTQAVGILGQIAQVDPGVVKLLDGQATVRKAFELLHVPPEMLRDNKEVEALMQQEAQAAQAQQQMQQMQEMAQTAKNAAEIPTDENHVLGQLMQSMGGGKV